MTRAKLNDDYNGEFLTTQMGQIFYRKDNRYNKSSDFQEVDMSNKEIFNLIEQGILVVEGKGDVKKVIEEDKKLEEKEQKVSETVKESKTNIVQDNLFENSIKEVKTKSNDEKLNK